MSGSVIAGTGAALPANALTSSELEVRLELEPGWIATRTGIHRRRIASRAETSCSLSTAAARAALGNAGVDAGEVDAIIVATVTPDFLVPAAASLLQTALGCDGIAYDLNAGCSGFLCGLAQADALVRAGAANSVLVVGADLMSRIADFSDPKSGILFGDGAGAAVVTAAPSGSLGPFAFHSDGSRPDLLWAARDGGKVVMAGREVYKRAVAEMTASVREVLAAADASLDDVALVVAHQANARILDAVAQRLGVAREKLFTNVDRYGNTSAASIPIALTEAAGEGLLNEGDLVMLAAFGSGLVWGAGLVRWTVPAVAVRPSAEAGAARA